MYKTNSHPSRNVAWELGLKSTRGRRTKPPRRHVYKHVNKLKAPRKRVWGYNRVLSGSSDWTERCTMYTFTSPRSVEASPFPIASSRATPPLLDSLLTSSRRRRLSWIVDSRTRRLRETDRFQFVRGTDPPRAYFPIAVGRHGSRRSSILRSAGPRDRRAS